MSKKIIINEKQLKTIVTKMLNGGIVPENYVPRKLTMDNIFLIAEHQQHLYEGIYATYPIEKVRRFLLSYYRLPENAVTIEDAPNGEQSLIVLISNIDENKKEMDKSMALCGYFPSFISKPLGDEYLEITYEKNINDDADGLVKKKGVLYHVTPSIYVDDILQNGLCPKSKNKKFSYPNRIYFTLDKLDVRGVKAYAKMLYPHIKQNDYTKENEIYDKFALIQINIKELNIDNYSFYKDPNLDNAVYTTDNIPPEAIYVKYRNINVN